MPVLKILQTLNSCSSISACDGNASSSAISQQGQFESHQEKDQLQQSSHADGSANDRLVSTNTNGTNNQQARRQVSSASIENPAKTNHQTIGTNNTMIDQTRQINNDSLQLIQSPNRISDLQQHTALGQFNYNPLYMSSQESDPPAQHRNQAREKSGCDVGNPDERSAQLNQDEEDLLDDIYQYQQQQQQQQQHQLDFEQQRNQSSTSSPSSSTNLEHDHCNGSTNNQRHRTKQQQHQIYSGTGQQPSAIVQHNSPATFNEIHQSMPLGGACRQTLRRSNTKGELDRKRQLAMHSSTAGASFNQQQQISFQNQQQQFMVASTSGHPMEIAEECNGGLFVEYQTNRNHLGGLEELHSLNVTNCDSETLEEQINMLSSEDCFATSDDLQDFAIGSTNDHFLNMLSLGAASGVANGAVMAGQSIDGGQMDGMSGMGVNQVTLVGQQHASIDQSSGMVRPTNEKSEIEQPNLAGQNETARQIILDKKQSKSKHKESPPRAAPNGVAKRSRGRKRSEITSNSSSHAHSYDDEDFTSMTTGEASKAAAAAILQDKITTTNTNKRLLPTKKNNSSATKSSRNDQASKKKNNSSSSWMSSPNSPPVSTNSSFSGLSPSSSSQMDMAETPYRQQLENLRKKLKMDAPPPLVSGSEESSSDKKSSELTGNIVMAQHQQQHHQQQQHSYLRTTAPISQTGAGGIMVSSQDATNCLLPAASIKQLQLNQDHPQQQQQQPCATTYVLARQIEQPQGFEAAPGTIFLRTSNGSLVQLNSDRRSATVVQIGGQNDADYSSTSSGANSSSSRVINCVGSTRASMTSSYTSSGGGGQQQQQQQQHHHHHHQQYVDSSINSRGPTTAGIIFQSQNHHQQQQSNDEPLISAIDLNGNQTLLIPANGDDLDASSSKQQHHSHSHPHHHSNAHQQQQKHLIQSPGEQSSSSAGPLLGRSLFNGPVLL